MFTEADEDKDEQLNLAEYLSFVEKCEAEKSSRGEPSVPKTKEQNEAMFNVLNKITPTAEGVSKADIATAFNVTRRFITEGVGPNFYREFPLSEAVRAEMVPVLQKDVDFIKGWTPEQRESQSKVQGAKVRT